MQKHLILFDIDGTLLNTKGIGRVSTKLAMQEVFGTASTIEDHVFGGKTDWFTLAELLLDHGFTVDEIGKRMPDYERSIARYLEGLIAENNTALPCPGAMEAVHHLRGDENTLLAIVTGNCSSTAPIKLRAAGFDPAWFPVGAYGSEALERNDLPPLAIQRAVDHSGWDIRPQQVTVIGDTVADIECARAVGARVIAVCTGHNTRERLMAAQPDHLLDDLTTLFEVL